MELPEYFDSQAQAAAMLNMSIYDIKMAKAHGCPAFRGGRIRRREFQAWWREHFEPLPSSEITDGEDWPQISNDVAWPYKAYRREMLFSLIEYIEKALKNNQITDEEFCAIGEKTIPLVIELGRIWNAPFTEKQQAGMRRKLTRVEEKLSEKLETSASGDNKASISPQSDTPSR